jgi:hypothetical protein
VELDKDRLAKLLSMTGSDHDAEALAAMRKANELLRLHGKSWQDILTPPPEPPRTGAPRYTTGSTMPPRAAEPPPGHQRLRYYRDALRHEPFLPRLLGFPFWFFIELLALAFPNTIINTRGRFISFVFAMGMLLGITGWVWLGYYLLFVM